MTVPTDARLPGGGGNQLTYYNVNPNKLGQTQNYNTLSDKFGEEYRTLERRGRQRQRTARERPAVPGRDQHRAYGRRQLRRDRAAARNADVWRRPMPAGTTAGGHSWRPGVLPSRRTVADGLQRARRLHDSQSGRAVRGHLPQRARASRTRNGAGAGGAQPSGLAANFVATNAYLAANSNLGRLLTGTTTATQNTTLQIINPDTVYLDRDNQLDFRVGKVFKFGRTRIDGQSRPLQHAEPQHGPDGERGVRADQQRRG